MNSLLMLDDQLYTVEAFAERARIMDFEVERTDSVLPFKQKAEEWASEGRSFVAAIDMNLPGLSELEVSELGATREEIGTGEAAGLVVAKHIFANGHAEPLRTALNAVPIAMISAENIAPEVRRDIEELRRARSAETSYIPKPDNPSKPIPNGTTFDAFLAKFRSARCSQGGVVEQAILMDVRKLMNLSSPEMSMVLGLTDGAADLDALLERGTDPATRDWKDRLHHLSDIVVILLSIYRRSDAKKWLVAPLAVLNGKSPRATLLTGDVVDLLMVKQVVMDLGNPY